MTITESQYRTEMTTNHTRVPTRVTLSVEEETDEWLHPPPYNYHIFGYETEGELEIGVKSVDESPAHPDVISDRMYDRLTSRIEPMLDRETVHRYTNTDTMPLIGKCTIEEGPGDTRPVTIELVNDFVEE